MATPASQVLEQALELTPAERLELARELITSVEPEQSPEWATAWKAEIASRWSAYDTGSDPGVPFDDEIARVRDELRSPRP
jgi:putative addiction module component (TIGR02574 family)